MTPWTVACQAPLSMGFSRQEYRIRLPFPSPGDLPNPGIEHKSLMSPALAGRSFTTSATWEAPTLVFLPGEFHVQSVRGVSKSQIQPSNEHKFSNKSVDKLVENT